MRQTTKFSFLLIGAIVFLHIACTKFDEAIENPNQEWLSAGVQTMFDQGSGAYGHMFNNMPSALQRVHEIGDGQFEATFVTAPAPLNPGLGPLLNNVSCSSCHVSDGRGKIPGAGETAANMLFRISIPGEGAQGNPVPVPNFGDQIQTRAVLGVAKEAEVNIHYTNANFTFADGTPYQLRVPAYTIVEPYSSLPANLLLSPRVAAPVFGLGLLEAISEQDILHNADENDSDHDGISGKPNQVWDVLKKKAVLGRFGWKANQPSILQQVAAAYNGDMGITSSIFQKESSEGQTQFQGTNDGSYELTDSLLHSVDFYIRTLGVPARRNVDQPEVKAGKALFLKVGCGKCHIPDFKTAVNVSFPQISNQIIHPYSDLLLHDMGDGLADNRPDFKASGKEWRTQPLWGIGLTKKVNGHTNFLHDGRARSLMEAVLWHGGEAENAKNKVVQLSANERKNLISFLESL